MVCLLFSLWLATGPSPVAEPPIEGPIEAPLKLAGPIPTPIPEPAPAPEPKPKPPHRLSKGQRLMIGSGVAYGLGAAIVWATAGGSGMLEGRRPNGSSGVALGMTLGGMAMLEGVVLAGVGAPELARDDEGPPSPRGKRLIAGGAVIASLGAGTLVGTMMFWPSIRDRCPIGPGCAIAGLQVGGAMLGVGAGMTSYGDALRRRDPDHHRLSKQAKQPVIAGGVLLGMGYVVSATLGMQAWQEDPRDPANRRLRDRMLIPVVGPWIHAAGPDAPVLVAMATGLLGALQIGGAISVAVGAGIAGSEHKRSRARARADQRVQVRVIPSFDGVTVVGRF